MAPRSSTNLKKLFLKEIGNGSTWSVHIGAFNFRALTEYVPEREEGYSPVWIPHLCDGREKTFFYSWELAGRDNVCCRFSLR
jgi:hypothetical protein